MELIYGHQYNKTKNKALKIIKSTSTDDTFRGAWCNRVVAKQEDSHSTATADKQINE